MDSCLNSSFMKIDVSFLFWKLYYILKRVKWTLLRPLNEHQQWRPGRWWTKRNKQKGASWKIWAIWHMRDCSIINVLAALRAVCLFCTLCAWMALPIERNECVYMVNEKCSSCVSSVFLSPPSEWNLQQLWQLRHETIEPLQNFSLSSISILYILCTGALWDPQLIKR